MRIVVEDLDITELKRKEIVDVRVQSELRQCLRRALELLLRLLHVIAVEVHVAEDVHEITGTAVVSWQMGIAQTTTHSSEYYAANMFMRLQ
jgi:hypothetical protein